MTRKEIKSARLRSTTKCAQRKARRAGRPTHWGFPHWWEHGAYRSLAWLSARGKSLSPADLLKAWEEMAKD